MSYDEYLNEWSGRQVTQYGSQCVAGVAEYEAENNLPIVYGNAYQWINNYIMLSAYDWIDNNPNDPNQLPERGDIIVWNQHSVGSGGYGHIAFYDMQIDNTYFQSFGQNWGGHQMHFQTVLWANVAGWYHIKQEVAAPVPTPDPEPVAPPEPIIITPDPVPEPTPPPYTPPTGAIVATSPVYETPIIKQLPGYETMTDAQNKTNPVDVVSPGVTYYLLTTKGGMDCLMTVPKGGQGVWINPTSNVPDPTPEQVKTITIDEIKKQWGDLATASKPLVTAVTSAVTAYAEPPVSVDNSWKAMTPFLGIGGIRKPIEFELLKNYDITDLAGHTNAVGHLKSSMTINIAGTFKKDGIKYYRPVKGMDGVSWWGIPVVDHNGYEIIQIRNEVVRLLDTDPDYVRTPINKNSLAKTLAESKYFVDEAERFMGRIFDVFSGKRKRK